MEASKELANQHAERMHSKTSAGEQNNEMKSPGNRKHQADKENQVEPRPGTNERKADSQDMRHLNAEQDEEQLRKDEEARRNHKSK